MQPHLVNVIIVLFKPPAYSNEKAAVRNWFNQTDSTKGLRIMLIEQRMGDTCMADNPWLKNIVCYLRHMKIYRKDNETDLESLKIYSASIVTTLGQYFSKYGQKILIYFNTIHFHCN